MSLRKALKKSIAVLTVMTLFAGSAAGSAFAAEGDGSSDPTKPTIYIDYLGSATGSSIPDKGPLSSPQSYPGFKSEGIVFWVGVRLSHLDQVSFLRNGGIHDLELAFDYNPEYVVPADNLDEASCSSSYDMIDEASWTENIKKFNFSSADNTPEVNAERWSSDDYTLAGYSTPAADPDAADGREYDAPAGWKSQFISILKNADTSEDTNRFYGADDTDDHYILKVPFFLKAVPADGAKPLVFRLALGPSSLVMTSGADGETTYSWEKEDRTEPELNLKNIFQFDKDLNIFKEEEGVDELSMLRVLYNEDETEKTATLYADEEQTAPSPYTPSKYDYYLAVPVGTDRVKLVMSGMDNAPTVEHSDRATPAVVTPITGIAHDGVSNEWSVEVPLTGSAGTSDYKDIAVITVGENVYNVYIKKAAPEPSGEARIELAPGNSPYGLIERMGEKYYTGDGEAWSEEKIQAAKDAFDVGNRFAAGFVPDNGTETVFYSPRAWFGLRAIDPDELTDPTKNIDRDPYAQFVYNTIDFSDAGYEVYDSTGKKVENPEVTMEVTVRRLNTNSIDCFVDSRSSEVTLPLEADENGIITAFAAGANNPIRPDKYELVYTWVDPSTGQVAATKTRQFIIINRLGDMDSSKTVDGSDVTKIKDINAESSRPFVGVPDSVRNLHEMRTMDVDNSGTLDGSDVTKIKDINAGSTPIVYYYNLSK